MSEWGVDDEWNREHGGYRTCNIQMRAFFENDEQGPARSQNVCGGDAITSTSIQLRPPIYHIPANTYTSTLFRFAVSYDIRRYDKTRDETV